MTGVPFPRKDKNDKACAQLQQEVGDVFHQRGLDVALAGLLTHIQKIEAVRVFQRFARQIGRGFCRLSSKLVMAVPLRSSRHVSMWMFSALRDQPCSMAALA